MNPFCKKPFPSFPRPLYQNEVKCSAFDIEVIFHSHANKTVFHKKGCALGLILKVRVFGTWKWPNFSPFFFYCRSFMHFLTGVCAIVGGIFTGTWRLFVGTFLAVLSCPFSSSSFLLPYGT